jgi:hypothetical protein
VVKTIDNPRVLKKLRRLESVKTPGELEERETPDDSKDSGSQEKSECTR